MVIMFRVKLKVTVKFNLRVKARITPEIGSWPK